MSDQSNVGYYRVGYFPVILPRKISYGEQVSQHLLANLATAVNAEYNAIRAYEVLAQLASNEDFRSIITHIRNDEMGHFRNFSQIFTMLTNGRQPQLVSKPLPTDFLAGLEDSLRDELEDSKFYQETTSLTTEPIIITDLRNASADEARHATWFSYMWNKSR